MKHILTQRGCYSILSGERSGQIFVCIKKEGEQLLILTIPELEAVRITIKDFETGMESKILGYVETLPQDIFDACVVEYEGRLNY